MRSWRGMMSDLVVFFFIVFIFVSVFLFRLSLAFTLALSWLKDRRGGERRRLDSMV
ncbi:hypothetical protein P168DRAFT_16596 [Aspergillus campestris IBT 28561]|uniref:Uncharacterized protein n=1 Tax=Aspergillus campestris (strain IBT 28561) TaxID=1392248 RepID=A0A2I1DEX2_ASPC2|nr:uncharacterized protein P168DRAFT_16596 [Aspergillus campestris IBT 28561]PKY08433.1 hypothetical protein P168DRAFT_16596 [Aspergillus campestris IBT 28561]